MSLNNTTLLSNPSSSWACFIDWGFKTAPPPTPTASGLGDVPFSTFLPLKLGAGHPRAFPLAEKAGFGELTLPGPPWGHVVLGCPRVAQELFCLVWALFLERNSCRALCGSGSSLALLFGWKNPVC